MLFLVWWMVGIIIGSILITGLVADTFGDIPAIVVGVLFFMGIIWLGEMAYA